MTLAGAWSPAKAFVVSPEPHRYKRATPPPLTARRQMPDYAAARLNMVETQVRPNDVTDLRIQKAMLEIAREDFVPAERRTVAYMEGPVEVKPGRSLLDPRTLAKLAQLAAIRPTDVLLDVGCATGYSTAVLARSASVAIGLEEDAELARKAADLLRDTPNAEVVHGRLADGLARHAPYDVIFFNGATEFRPEALLAQLKEGGRLVCVIRESAAGHAHLFVKGEDAISDRIAFDSQPALLPGFQKPRAFAF
jgi:protein-L-isoaspartate(D-aspartate) O-methyltransferase